MSWLPRLLAAALLAPVVLVPAAAKAQGAPQMQVGADVDTVGVGDVVHLELSAQSADGLPSDPQPGATPGFVVRGPPRSAPSQTHISINGARTDRYTLTVDWTLQAQRVGSFSVGPPTVALGGTRYSSHALTIRVVPAGQVPQRQPPQGMQPQGMPFNFSPFDPWKSFLQGPDRDPLDVAPATPTADPKLALDAPRAPYYFLHATVDKASAVVGEQVTFSVFEYLDWQEPRNIEAEPTHEPDAADFVKHPLLPEDKDAPLAGFASVGGHIWRVTLIRRWALFPLRTGDLDIGPLSVSIVRPRLQNSARTSETLRVHVTEPPAAGRPPGYVVGDVGRFALAAQSAPREVDQGGAVGVHVELSGTGNVPASIAPPARQGVEWLTPELHDQLGVIGRDVFGGKRSFDFVVRMHRAGDVDLGEVSVPFWDPEQRRYDVASAKLGAVHVKPSKGAAVASGAADPETLAGLPAPRDALEGTPAARAHLDDSRAFWWLGVGAWPVAFGVAVAGRATGRRMLRAWHERRASPASELRERVAGAAKACAADDPRVADAAIARVLEAATVAHAGVSVRGAIGGEVVERLERAGVERDAATSVAELLRECEAARFSPTAADVAAARDRWARARDVLRQLEKRG
jgi:hypothetical protein